MINLKLTLRTLFRSPFVTAVAILSLALGIGANAAIFSLFDQMLLRPLPVERPNDLVNLASPGPKPGSQSTNLAGRYENVFSYLMFRDLERHQKVFTGIAAHRLFGANLAYRGQTLSGEAVLVSGSYFPVLGLRPALGRLIDARDDRAPGASPVVVLSHNYWRKRFNQDPGVLDQALVVNGQALTIVGVAPEGFLGTTLGADPHIFVPVTLRETMEPHLAKGALENRRAYWAYLFARLKPGVTLEQAQAALNVQYHAIINDVEAPLQKGMSDETMKRFRAKQVGVAPGARGQSNMHREARVPLLILLGVTGLVLLIACANIANLLLARGAGRASEMAVRLAIGGGRTHLVAQLLSESIVLGILGGAVGLLFARWTLYVIASLLPAEALTTVSFSLDPRAVGFSAVLALATGLVFGLFPALHSTRPDLVSALKGTAGQPGGARSAARFRLSLATAQIALSMALLAAAGLFTKSLLNVSRVDLGVKVDNLVTFSVAPLLNGYAPRQSLALFERLEEQLGALPGTTSASGAMVPIISGSSWYSDVAVEGFQSGPDTDSNAAYNEVGPGYFRTMGVPLLAGREFVPADAAGSPKVAIVNQAFTRKFNLGRSAVGKRMASRGKKELDIEIVGVVPDIKYDEVKAAAPAQYFTPYRQDDTLGFLTFYLRTSLAPEQLLPVLPKTVARLDSNLPVDNTRTMPQQIRENVFVDRIVTVLSAGFAALATLLASVGLYGVLAYTVAQRTREIGLRMALGASPGHVRRMVVRQVLLMTLVGGTIGLVAAIGLGRGAKALLYEIQGHDPLVLTSAAVVLGLVALGAGFIPAFRASQVDPMRALRYE